QPARQPRSAPDRVAAGLLEPVPSRVAAVIVNDFPAGGVTPASAADPPAPAAPPGGWPGPLEPGVCATGCPPVPVAGPLVGGLVCFDSLDRKSTRLNSSH